MDEREFECCIEAMQKGDRQGLRQIYEAYARYIYRIVYGILSNRENAEDVTSEFFIKLWEKADYYKPGGGHKGYLATMARNMAIDFLRKYKREELTAVVHDMKMDEEEREKREASMAMSRRIGEEQEHSVESEVIAKINLQEILQNLKPGEQCIVNMKVLGGLTFKEIAEALAIPMGTVTWQYQNAIKKLRRCGYEEF